MADPKGFLKFQREEIPKREARERIGDWKEFYLPVPENRLSEQASRCMDCGVPFCHSHVARGQGCPVENLIPEWNKLATEGRWRDALDVLHSTNNFPEFTGKLCPAPCESACVLSINSSPVTIRSIESNIVERGFTEGFIKPVIAPLSTGKKAAVVGSGPAGLAAAQQLARLGHNVRVYEKNKKLGGLLRYGIPDFKMEKKAIDRRLEQLRGEGVQFFTETEVGRDLSVSQLIAENDAVCITVGAELARELQIPGRSLSGVMLAMDYLCDQNRKVSGELLERQLPQAKDAHVVILGGGDTGSDCLGTALRQGAARVTQLELMPKPPEKGSSETPWPQWTYKLRSSHAHEENESKGGAREWAVMTKRFLADPKNPNQLGALECVKLRWQENRFEEIPGSQFQIPANLALIATGFTGVVRSSLFTELGIELDPHGKVAVKSDWMTSRRGVFAAGDASRGASLIVWAISEGRKMAQAVHQYLSALTQ